MKDCLQAAETQQHPQPRLPQNIFAPQSRSLQDLLDVMLIMGNDIFSSKNLVHQEAPD